MNIRNMINRKITYSIVEVEYEGMLDTYCVYGKTNPRKEYKRVKDYYKGKTLPMFKITEKTEHRVMSIDQFLENSELIKEIDNKEMY